MLPARLLRQGGNASVGNISGAVVSQPAKPWWHFSGVIPLPAVSPPSVFKGIQRWPRRSSRQSEELLPARGSPVSCPFTRALLVQSKAASLSTCKAEERQSALSFPAASRASEACEQHQGSSALTLLRLVSGLWSRGFSSHGSDSGICFL